jgi:hypothetical protein
MNIGMDLAILKNFPLRRQGQGLSFLGKKILLSLSLPPGESRFIWDSSCGRQLTSQCAVPQKEDL